MQVRSADVFQLPRITLIRARLAMFAHEVDHQHQMTPAI